MHGIIYRHIGRTGLGWIDGQKSSVFRRGNLATLPCSQYVHVQWYRGTVTDQMRDVFLRYANWHRQTSGYRQLYRRGGRAILHSQALLTTWPLATLPLCLFEMPHELPVRVTYRT